MSDFLTANLLRSGNSTLGLHASHAVPANILLAVAVTCAAVIAAAAAAIVVAAFVAGQPVVAAHKGDGAQHVVQLRRNAGSWQAMTTTRTPLKAQAQRATERTVRPPTHRLIQGRRLVHSRHRRNMP